MCRILAVALALSWITLSDARILLRPTFAGEAVVLVGAEARAVFEQCSRAAPVPSAILAGPSSAEIEQLEQVVERHISAEYEANRPSPPNITYARQYVAYQVGHQRMIYGNYYPFSHPPTKGRAVVICDGGPQFWGVEFNPKTGKVQTLAFNGPG